MCKVHTHTSPQLHNFTHTSQQFNTFHNLTHFIIHTNTSYVCVTYLYFTQVQNVKDNEVSKLCVITPMSYTFHTNFIQTLHQLYTFHSHFIRTLHTLHSNTTSQQILDTHFTATSQQHQTYFTHTYIHFTTTTPHRTLRMFDVVSMCEGCCEVFGEVY